jgi:hypothetical protein
MASCWCIWGMFLKQMWSEDGHRAGPDWTVEKIMDIWHNVVTNVIAEKPENIFGCTELPIFDAIPIDSYSLCVLQIMIGIRNSLSILFDWVEWRIEKLTPAEVTHRNTVMYAKAKVQQAKEKCEHWLDNEDVALATKTLGKKTLKRIFF